jgi:Kef-type K+ transport system membrane component KefB/predicted transcriptional regulator
MSAQIAHIGDTLFLLGIMLVVAFPMAELARRLHLPKVIGYLAGGLILGPSGLDILHKAFLETLTPFSDLIFAYILFLVGTHLEGRRLRALGFRGLGLVLFQILVVLLVMFPFVFFWTKNFWLSLLLGLIAAEVAPAATAFVVEEYGAEGRMVDTLFLSLAVTAVVILIGSRILIPIVAGEPLLFSLETSFWLLGLSAFFGFLLGLMMSYAEVKIRDADFLLLATSGVFLVGIGYTQKLGASPLLTALFAGITAENSSLRDRAAVRRFLGVAPLMYAVFFFLAGAKLHLDTLWTARYGLLVYVFLRTTGKYLGAWIPIRKSEMDFSTWDFTRSTLTHAGLTVAIAFQIGRVVPDQGETLMYLLLGAAALFEVIGPLFLRQALVDTGEVRAYRLLRKGIQPILDLDFQHVLHEFFREFGLTRLLRPSNQETLRAHHVMSRRFNRLRPEDDLPKILQVFEQSPCGALPVQEESGVLLGMVVLADLDFFSLHETTQRLVLSVDLARPVPRVREEDPLDMVFLKFRETGLDCLPVVNQKGFLVGVIRRPELLAAMS